MTDRRYVISHYQANPVPAQVNVGYQYAAQAPPPPTYYLVQNGNVHQPHTQAAVVHRQQENKYEMLYVAKIGDTNVLVASPLEVFYNCPNNVVQFYQLQIVKVYDPRHGIIRQHPVTYYDTAETLRIKAIDAQKQAQINLQTQMNAQAQQRAHRAQGLLKIQIPEKPQPEPAKIGKIDKATWIEEETPTFKKFQDNFTSTDFLNFNSDNVWSFANAKEETFLTKRCSTPENKKKVDLEETLKNTNAKLSPVESLPDTIIGYSSTETESIKSYASVLAQNLDTLKVQEQPKTETEKPFKKWIDDKTSMFFTPRKPINDNANVAAAENKCPNYNSNAKPETRINQVFDLKVAHKDDWDAKATSPKMIPSTRNHHEKSHTKAKNDDWTRKNYSHAKGGYRGWDGNWKRGETINDKAFERNGNSKAPYNNKNSERNEFDSKGNQKQQGGYKPKGVFNNSKKYNPKFGQHWKNEWYSKTKAPLESEAAQQDNWHTDWDPQPMQLKKLDPKIDPQDELKIKSQVPRTKKKVESKVAYDNWNWYAESPVSNNKEVASDAAQDFNWKSDGGQLLKMDTLTNLDDWHTEEPFHYNTRNFTNSNYGKEVQKKIKPTLAEEFNEFGKRKMPTIGPKSKAVWP